MCLANKFYLAPGLRHILTLRLHPCVFSFLQAALTGASAWILEETTGSMLAWNIQSEIIYLKDLERFDNWTTLYSSESLRHQPESDQVETLHGNKKQAERETADELSSKQPMTM